MPTPQQCRYCGEWIIFARASKGRWVVLDATPHPQGTRLLDEDGNCGPAQPGARIIRNRAYLPHWLGCQELPP